MLTRIFVTSYLVLNRNTRSVLQYMLDEKADCSFELLDKKSDKINVPNYIIEAIQWLIKD